MLGLALGFLLLPVALRLVATRSLESDDIEIQAQIAPWWGLAGVRVTRREPAWELVPVVASRPLAPRIRLGGDDDRPVETPAKPVPAVPSSEPEPADDEPADDEPDAAPPAEAVRQRLRRQLSLMRAMLSPAARLVCSLPSVLGLRRLEVHGAFGLDNPASTGQLCGLLHAVAPFVPGRLTLCVQPDFRNAGVHGHVDVRMHFYLARFLWIVARFGARAGWVWLVHWVRDRRQAVKTTSS